MIIMITMMMIMITIMILMVMRRMKPSLWLKILSKLISPVFSRYLIITDLTIIPISIQVLIKSISILISQKKLYFRPTSRSDLAGRSFCSPEQLENICLHFSVQLYFVWSVCVWFTWRAFTFFHCHQIAHLKRLLFSSFNLFAILINRATLTKSSSLLSLSDDFCFNFLTKNTDEKKNNCIVQKRKALVIGNFLHLLHVCIMTPLHKDVGFISFKQT